VIGVRLTKLAESDLEEIVDYVLTASGVDRANNLLSEIDSAFHLLAGARGIGHERSDLAADDIRFWVVHHYLIAYVIHNERPVIVRILHGARSTVHIGDSLRDQDSTT